MEKNVYYVPYIFTLGFGTTCRYMLQSVKRNGTEAIHAG